MMLQQFIERYNGQIVSFDGDPQNAGQAVQLIAQWCDYIGLPYQWANPGYWWDDSDETFAEHWRKVPRARGEQPSPGDIVIFSTQLPGSDGNGHASIFVGDNSDAHQEWIGFDANWGSTDAHQEIHSAEYVLGWFTPINPDVVASRIATPIAEPYEMDIQAIADTPEPDLGVFTTDLPPPPEVPPPVYIPGMNMHSPVTAPNPNDTIQILRDIPTYKTMTAALQGNGSIGLAQHRKYFVYKRMPNGAINITLKLGVYGAWINKVDLDAPEEPVWHLFTRFQHPIWYRALENTDVVDIDGKGPTLPIKKNQRILISGFFYGPLGTKYMAPSLTINQEPTEWYGLEEDFLSAFTPEPEQEEVLATAEGMEVVPARPQSVRDTIQWINYKVVKYLREKSII